MSNKTTMVEVRTEDLTDADLRTNIKRLRKLGETEHADELQRFLDIGPKAERRKFWKWYTGTHCLLTAIQIVPEPDDVWVPMQKATEEHLVAAMKFETGHRRAIIEMFYKGLKPFLTTPTTTVKEANDARNASVAKQPNRRTAGPLEALASQGA